MAGIDAFGTKWAISSDGGTTYTDVAELTNIGVLDVKADTIETTTHASTGEWRTFIGGLKDGGDLKMDINYDPALHATIFSKISGAALKHKVTLTDAAPAATVIFDGVITGFQASAPYDDKLSGSITVKVSGAPVITP